MGFCRYCLVFVVLLGVFYNLRGIKMRKIEQNMIAAIKNRKAWAGGNTSVVYLSELDEPLHARIEHAKVYLHGNHIATYNYKADVFCANPSTLAKYPTPTTKSRLRALGINVYTRGGVTFLDGVAV